MWTLFHKIYKNSIFGMTDEDFSTINHKYGPDLDKLVEKYDLDLWIIFSGVLLIVLFKIYLL